MMNKQKIILASIFVVTIIIGLSAIVLSNVLTSKNKAPTTTNTTAQVPTLTSYALVCSSSASNKSLTITWQAPSNAPSGDVIEGQISDLSTQSDPVSIGPLPISQGAYVFDNANGLDTYYAALWIQDANGNKGAVVTTNQINSSECTSGTQPTPSAPISVTAATSTPTPTSTQIPTTTSTLTATPSVATTTTTSNLLACNAFTLTQGGTQLTSAIVAPGSSALTITSGITSSAGTVDYSSAQWSINPSVPALNVSTDGTNATWTPPSDTSGGSSYTITLTGVADSAGNTLSSPCTLTVTLSGNSPLPNTAGNVPTIVVLLTGLFLTLTGMYLFFKKETY